MLCCVGLIGGMAVGQSLGGPWTYIAPAAGFGIGLVADMKFMGKMHHGGGGRELVSADWIGVMRNIVEKELGGLTLFLQGAAANIACGRDLARWVLAGCRNSRFGLERRLARPDYVRGKGIPTAPELGYVKRGRAPLLSTNCFPEHYAHIALYFKEVKGVRWQDVDPRTVMSADYSSAAGMQANVLRELQSRSFLPQQSGADCSV